MTPTSKMQDILIVVIFKDFVFDPDMVSIKISLQKLLSESFYYSLMKKKNIYMYIYTQTPVCVFPHSLLISGYFPPIAKAQQ